MKKIFSILFSILLGALTVGLTTGYFLYLANKDRSTLAQELQAVRLKMIANKKISGKEIQTKNNELQLTQKKLNEALQKIKSFELKNQLLDKAQYIKSVKNKSNWHSILSTDFNLSFLIPQNAWLKTNNNELISVESFDSQDATSTLITVAFNKDNFYEKEKNKLSKPKTVTYFVDGKILSGVIEEQKDTDILVLKVLDSFNDDENKIIVINNFLKNKKIETIFFLETLQFKKDK